MKKRRLNASVRIFVELLLKGQQVDWKYSLVIVLVITGMFSTPLALGSIRNRVYAAVKEQIEKENNAREVSIQLARDDAPPLDQQLISGLQARFPDLQAVGNHKLVVSVEGPEGADFLTLQTLVSDDPRQDPLGIIPALPEDFGLTDLVVSDALGRLLYGGSWDSLWTDEGFQGPPLELRINELSVTKPLQAVARRTLPGRGLYGSQDLGVALRRFTRGFGSAELGLPVDPGLVAHALPRLAATSCIVLLDEADPTCDDVGRDRLLRRFRELQLEVDLEPSLDLPSIEGYQPLRVPLTELLDEGDRVVRREILGDCEEALALHLVESCSSAFAWSEINVRLQLERSGGLLSSAEIMAAPAAVRAMLPGRRELADQRGVAPPRQGSLGLTVAASSKLELAEEVSLRVGAKWLGARVEGFYRCPETDNCPAFADPKASFRLQNLQAGTIELISRDPLTYIPANLNDEFDEVLVYVPRVEEVEAVSKELRSLYPGTNVQYNIAALDKLQRQNSRLSTLFNITIVLSALFIVLAIGALARINIERRSRQMAQMLLLGFSRRFVRFLIVAEYLFLTTLSSVAALGLTAFFCAVARCILGSSANNAERGFRVIVQSMNVDTKAFLQVFFVVAVCTWFVALLSARKAASTDPLNLLD